MRFDKYYNIIIREYFNIINYNYYIFFVLKTIYKF